MDLTCVIHIERSRYIEKIFASFAIVLAGVSGDRRMYLAPVMHFEGTYDTDVMKELDCC